MLKYDLKLDLTADELGSSFQAELNQAVDMAAPIIGDKAGSIAKSTLKSSLGIWQKGFIVEQITSGIWVIGMEEGLPTMMEDGFTAKEFQNMIFSSNRAMVNKGQGKDYVDIPMHQNVNEATGMIGKTKVAVQHFKDADSLQKQFYIKSKGGTPGSGTIPVELASYKRLHNVIESRPKSSAKPSYLMIRRLTKESNWPNYKGAKILERLDYEIEKTIEETLKKVMG